VVGGSTVVVAPVVPVVWFVGGCVVGGCVVAAVESMQQSANDVQPLPVEEKSRLQLFLPHVRDPEQ